MTLPRSSDPSRPSLIRAQSEASAWIALLHSSERDAKVETELKKWIAAHEIHRAAWEAATDIWHETSQLTRRIAPRSLSVRQPSRRRWLRPLPVAASILILLGAGTTMFSFFHSSVRTKVGEQRTLILEDGSRIELNTESEVVLRYDVSEREVLLKSGEAYFQVAHEPRPFVVIVGDQKVRALGTAFTVRHDGRLDDPTTVTLIEGRIAIADSAAHVPAPTELQVRKPGERVRFRRHQSPTLETSSVANATGWMRGQVIFDHTPLYEAAAEFNRYGPLEMLVASQSAMTIPVGGIFQIGDVRSFSRAVADTNHLRLTQRGNQLILEDDPKISLEN